MQSKSDAQSAPHLSASLQERPTSAKGYVNSTAGT